MNLAQARPRAWRARDAHFYGSMGGQHLAYPMIGMRSSKTGAGYWTVAEDGGIFAFGDALFEGSHGG